ncbi:hypothetical protein [Aeromicrobium choanae]|uniref:Uncharacterized protein n=1 Tax=Aeromicrobium choanae TaxID=1736691 RepID=A0A1T4Z7Y4_9ACTN|nr:hypothetical protein [Aeromicrobium choanae]SKB10084.1 hypothetical protein SAMN06295964_3091 [Aeromicrobium choanae]
MPSLEEFASTPEPGPPPLRTVILVWLSVLSIVAVMAILSTAVLVALIATTEF